MTITTRDLASNLHVNKNTALRIQSKFKSALPAERELFDSIKHCLDIAQSG